MEDSRGANTGRAAMAVVMVVVAGLVFQSVRLGQAQAELAQLRSEPKAAPAVARPFQPFAPVRFTTDFFGLSYEGDSQNLIDSHVLAYGAFEKHLLFLMRDVLKARAGEAGVVLDVGANRGHHALFLSRFARTVHAVEPYQKVLEPFRAMIARNGVSNVVIHQVGLADREEDADFHEPPPANLGVGSFVASAENVAAPTRKLHLVAGDALLSGAGVERIDLLKLDVEGFEKKALRGLAKTLQAGRPVVVVELSVDPASSEAFASLDELRELLPKDYDIYQVGRLGERSLYEGAYRLVAPRIDFRVAGQFNLACLPREFTPRLPAAAGTAAEAPKVPAP